MRYNTFVDVFVFYKNIREAKVLEIGIVIIRFAWGIRVFRPEPYSDRFANFVLKIGEENIGEKIIVDSQWGIGINIVSD